MRADLRAGCDTEAEAPVVTPTEGCQRLRAIRIWEIDTEPQKVVTPTEGRQRLKKLTSLMLQAQHILEHAPVAVVAIIVGLVTLFVHGYRLNVAPDIFSDEGIYLLVGANLARGAGLTLNHSVFQWHPPVYMLVEAAYIKLAGLTNADPLTALLSLRYLNIFFSASTAALLMLFGRKLHSNKAGLIMAVLFLMDPYVQRINRRNMLETMAMLCVLLGFYLFFTRRQRLTRWQRLGSGVAFGLAMLTKEAMFLELFALIAYVMWFRRSQLRDIAWVAAFACAIYLLYPIWEVAIGQGNSYLSYKLFGINRILSSITGRPPPPPLPGTNLAPAWAKTASVDNLQILLFQYGTSYLLIALAAIFTVVLILQFRHLVAGRYLITWFKHLVAGRYLITWSIVSFGLGLLLGRVSDQYFYYLIVPSTIVAGYVLASLLETFSRSRSPKKTSFFDLSRPVFLWNSTVYRIIWRAIFALFFVILLYNSYLWTEKYAVGSDDGYIKVIEYVRTHIPSGETFVTSDDVAYYFLSPSYNIRLDRDTKVIVDRCERYFIMSSKDAWGGYDATTPQFYDWVMKSSRPLFVQEEQSFWQIGVYVRTATAIGRDGQCSAPGLLDKAPSHSSPMATSTPTPIPPSTPSVTMVRSYLGTLYDIPTGQKTNILLTNIRQEQWNISGYFSAIPENSLFSGMPTNGPFTGTINAIKQVQFIVTNSTGQATCSFQGVINPDGSITGVYSNFDVSTGDYGLWSVSSQ